jgi:glycerate 2-kinase
MTRNGIRILIAPDKFKGSLGASEVAENIAQGLRDILTDAKIDIVPVADGGEGTADVICNALKGSWFKCNAHDPLGRKIKCRYTIIEKRKLGVIEMSEAAGMKRLHAEERDVDRASTFGVGEMILDATRRGAKQIIVGLGGSATNDGGFGLARALGFRFFDEKEKELKGMVSQLLQLRRIVRSKVDGLAAASSYSKVRPLQHERIVAAADVRNPLLGQNGATRVFGPQKGATDDKIDMLECALTRLAEVILQEFGFDYRNELGAGAAGGLGFGLMSFCGATIRPGFDVVAEAIELESRMKDVDIVITGEGSLDTQTLEGKTAAGVATMARKFGKRVYAIVGRTSEDREVHELFDGVYTLTERGVSEQESIRRAAELLRERARELAKKL